MKNIIICDIDGTIADASHRLHHINSQGLIGFKPDWPKFFAECVFDEPHHDIIALVSMCALPTPMRVIYVSGRSDIVYNETLEWLKQHNLPDGMLVMRKHGDHRPDYQVKEEILDKLRLTPDDVWFVLDDRNQVVEMWRRRGFRVLQVRDGNF